jgi:Holliday junction resolvase RusA-like endonuclease
MDTPVRVKIHQIRNRLGDIDNYYGKAVVDGIRASGLIPDDGPVHVVSVEYTHERTNGNKD